MAPERFLVLVVLIVAVICSLVTKSSSKSIEEVDDNVRKSADLEAVYDTETERTLNRNKRDADTEAVLRDESATGKNDGKNIKTFSKDEIEEIETRGLGRRSRRGSRSRRSGRSRRSRSRRSGRGRSRRSRRSRSRRSGRGRSRQSGRKGSNGSGGGSAWDAVSSIADAASTGLNTVNAGLDLANNLKPNNGDAVNDDTSDIDTDNATS